MMSGPPRCHRCGIEHWNWHPCPSFREPYVEQVITGGDMEETASLRRYNALQSLASTVHEASVRADATARLEAALRSLRPSELG